MKISASSRDGLIDLPSAPSTSKTPERANVEIQGASK